MDKRKRLRVHDITGNRYGLLEVLGLDYTKNHNSFWRVKCDCGNVVTKRRGYLIDKGGATEKNCGCLSFEKAKEYMMYSNPKKTHGLSKTRMYRIWLKMKERCNDPNYPERHLYGGRGIKVCDEWVNNFMNFREWSLENGYNDELSIDRIDPNGNYEPDNCRWIPLNEQSDNRRNSIYLEHDGKRMTMSQWSKELGLPVSTIRSRYYRDWPVEKILLPKKLRD